MANAYWPFVCLKVVVRRSVDPSVCERAEEPGLTWMRARVWGGPALPTSSN
jgi:hypothetical protein